MKKFLIAGIGELLWDVLPHGEVLGGAPVNFACHVNQLGATGIPVSTVGDDDRGRKALATLTASGMDVEGISVVPKVATGFVAARLDENGCARYHFPDDVAWDHLTITPYAQKVKPKLDAVCFGTLVQRGDHSRTALYAYLDSLPEQCLKVCDLNFRQAYFSREVVDHSLARADIVKLNDEELPVLLDLFKIRVRHMVALKDLLDRYHLKMVICTRGSKGSVIVTGNAVSDHPGNPCDVADTIGAGDAFAASVVTDFLKEEPLDAINDRANRVAAAVCAQTGGMPRDCDY